MEIVVSGSREFKGHSILPFRALSLILRWAAGAHEPLTVNNGVARGFDTYVLHWADTQRKRGARVSTRPYPAQWDRFGARAGLLRNEQMLAENVHRLDLSLCLPHPTIGSGTRGMMQLLRDAGIPVWELDWNDIELPAPPRARLVPAEMVAAK